MALSILYRDDKKVSFTKALIELGADPDREDDTGDVAAVSAIKSGRYKTAKALIQLGATVSEPVGLWNKSIWEGINNRAALDPDGIRKERLVEAARKKIIEEKNQIHSIFL